MGPTFIFIRAPIENAGFEYLVSRAGAGQLCGQRLSREGSVVDLILVRFIFVVFVSFTCFLIHPFGLSPRLDAGVGAVLGAAIVVFEWRLLRVSLKRLIGAAIGSILGIFGAYLFALVIRNSLADSSLRHTLAWS
jgi:ABC-type enterobactin transport system permease subunit